MIEANIILLNLRGGCTTVGDHVRALFRVDNRRSLLKQASDPAPRLRRCHSCPR